MIIAQSHLTPHGTENNMKGTHGEGWKAPCGQKCLWPGKLQSHRKPSARCKDIMDKNQTKWDKLAAKIVSKKK